MVFGRTQSGVAGFHSGLVEFRRVLLLLRRKSHHEGDVYYKGSRKFYTMDFSKSENKGKHHSVEFQVQGFGDFRAQVFGSLSGFRVEARV